MSQTMSFGDIKQQFWHGLKKLWKAFKNEFPGDGLNQFDRVIDQLDRFENIRYPDEILAEGAELIIALDRRAADLTGQQGGVVPPRYEVAASDFDELIAKIFEMSSRNPLFFTDRLNSYAREALNYENRRASFFLSVS